MQISFMTAAAKTLANLCRHTDNHAILAAHGRCLHHVAELLNANNEEVRWSLRKTVDGVLGGGLQSITFFAIGLSPADVVVGRSM